MGVLYVDTGGAAANSGCTDVAAGHASIISGTNATWTGTTTVTLDGSPNLSGLVTTGDNQSTINITGITNANRTIMWITAFDDTAKTVTVDAIVTGVSGKAWKIGGQYLWPGTNGVNVMEGAIGLGGAGNFPDGIQFNNTPATKTVAYFTSRVAGSVAKGMNFIRGKPGTRPVFNVTNTAVPIGISHAFWCVGPDLEFQQNGASGNVISFTGTAPKMLTGCKISDGGGVGVTDNGVGSRIHGNEISGVNGDCILVSNSNFVITGNYLHDNTASGTGDGIDVSSTAPSGFVGFNVIDTVDGRGIPLSGASATGSTAIAVIVNNTIYGCKDSGLEVTDIDTAVFMVNNILKDNGVAGTSYNVEQVAGVMESISAHMYNCFSIAGGLGGANYTGLTLAATETTSDPLFTNAAAGDFSLQSGSPCKGTGFPGQILGGNLGYMDMGAIQRQEASGGFPVLGGPFT